MLHELTTWNFCASNKELYEEEIRKVETIDNKGNCLREETELGVQ